MVLSIQKAELKINLHKEGRTKEAEVIKRENCFLGHTMCLQNHGGILALRKSVSRKKEAIMLSVTLRFALALSMGF